MKHAILFYGAMALGVLASAAGIYLATSLHFHERAYAVLGVGVACILASFVGKYARQRGTVNRWLSTSIYFDVLVFGILVSFAGVTLRLMAQYHTRAYVFLLVGMICLIVGLVRILVVPGIIKATYLFRER